MVCASNEEYLTEQKYTKVLRFEIDYEQKNKDKGKDDQMTCLASLL